MTHADPRKELPDPRSCPDPASHGPFDRALDLWLGRSQAASRIVWNVVAAVLAVVLAAAALGFIDWSPALVALLPDRAGELAKLLRRAASGP